MLTIIKTTLAPAAIGTYSQAVRCHNLLFVSGQIGADPKTGQLAADFNAQAMQAFTNLKAIIEAAKTNLASVLKLNVSVTDMSHFASFNEIMMQFFKEPYPARAVVGVAQLPKGALVEIEATVFCG